MNVETPLSGRFWGFVHKAPLHLASLEHVAVKLAVVRINRADLAGADNEVRVEQLSEKIGGLRLRGHGFLSVEAGW